MYVCMYMLRHTYHRLAFIIVYAPEIDGLVGLIRVTKSNWTHHLLIDGPRN